MLWTKLKDTAWFILYFICIPPIKHGTTSCNYLGHDNSQNINDFQYELCFTMTSYRGRLRLKLLAVRLLINRLFRRRSKKTSKLRVTGPCEGKSPGTGEVFAQMASNAENVSIWWRHQGVHCYSLAWFKMHSFIYEANKNVYCILPFPQTWTKLLYQCNTKTHNQLITNTEYRQVSNIRRTKSQHLKYSRAVLWLSFPNPLKPDVKSRMTM